jgi:bacterioferritin-associated ferredoxin
MYVCICNGVTDRQIRRAIDGGARSLQALNEELGVASQCGGCMEHALSMLEGEDVMGQALDDSLFYSPA